MLRMPRNILWETGQLYKNQLRLEGAQLKIKDNWEKQTILSQHHKCQRQNFGINPKDTRLRS